MNRESTWSSRGIAAKNPCEVLRSPRYAHEWAARCGYVRTGLISPNICGGDRSGFQRRLADIGVVLKGQVHSTHYDSSHSPRHRAVGLHISRSRWPRGFGNMPRHIKDDYRNAEVNLTGTSHGALQDSKQKIPERNSRVRATLISGLHTVDGYMCTGLISPEYVPSQRAGFVGHLQTQEL